MGRYINLKLAVYLALLVFCGMVIYVALSHIIIASGLAFLMVVSYIAWRHIRAALEDTTQQDYENRD